MTDATNTPRVVEFATQEALEDYVETQLNEKGIDPTVALIDSAGTQTVAHRIAPGGDGYAFVYAIHDRDPETGGLHCCDCYECGTECTAFMGEWSPTFPVWVFESVHG